jgi:7,8-dihydroneopterin aldolase/epimerase/oxygenase
MRSSGPSELGVIARPGQPIRRAARPAAAEAPAGAASAVQAAAGPAAQARNETRIFVRGLMVEAELGVYAHEKGSRRPLVVDLEVTVDPTVRPEHDQLAETIDYDGLVAHARAVAAGEHLHLIETFAEKVAERLLSDARITASRVRVEKPGAVPGAACSGVEIVRVR